MRAAVGCIVGFVVVLDLFWGEGSWRGVRGFYFPGGKGEWEDGKLILFLEVSKCFSVEVEV